MRGSGLPLAGATLAACALIAGCAPKATGPRTPFPAYRQVTVVLRDSSDAPLASAPLFLVYDGDVTSQPNVLVGTTDADGAFGAGLSAGAWTASASSGGLATAGEFVVAGAERAASDTQLVRLVTHTASTATGTVTLSGRTHFENTIVSGPIAAFAVTDSSGAWTMHGLPLGRWTLQVMNIDYASASVTVEVTTPGSQVAAPAVNLVPGSPGPAAPASWIAAPSGSRGR